MFILLKNNFRRLVAVCLISVSLFIAGAIALPQQHFAQAEVLKRDMVGISGDDVNDAAYESMKVNRNRVQAKRSQKAEEKAEAEVKSESVAEKLSLDEITVPGVGDVLDD